MQKTRPARLVFCFAVCETGPPLAQVHGYIVILDNRTVPITTIADKAHAELSRAFRAKDRVDRFVGDGISPSVAARAQFAGRIRDETALWRKTVQSSGIKLE